MKYFQDEKRNFVSTRAMKCSVYYVNKNKIQNHCGDLFTSEDNVLFSRVKVLCLRGKAHLVFHWCLQLFRQKLYNKKHKSVRDNAER